MCAETNGFAYEDVPGSGTKVMTSIPCVTKDVACGLVNGFLDNCKQSLHPQNRLILIGKPDHLSHSKGVHLSIKEFTFIV